MKMKQQQRTSKKNVKSELKSQLDRSDFTFTIISTPAPDGDGTTTIWFPDDKGPVDVLKHAGTAIQALEQLRDGLDEMIENMKDPR